MKNKLFGLALILTVLSMPMVFAADVGTEIPLTNVAPSVGTITATDPITLTAASTVTVWCNATITDTNGYADVTGVTSKLWNPSTTTEGGSDDYNNHYSNANCDLSGGSGNTIDASCSFTVRYSAQPAEWTCKLIATDTALTTGNAQKTDVTVNALYALSAPATMTFPETALNAIATEQTLAISNKGNADIDLNMYTYGASDNDGYSMTCTIGTIAFDSLKYNLTASQDFTDMSAIGRTVSTPVAETGFNLGPDSNATASSKNTYWKIQVPASGVAGTCTGTLVVLATSS